MQHVPFTSGLSSWLGEGRREILCRSFIMSMTPCLSFGANSASAGFSDILFLTRCPLVGDGFTINGEPFRMDCGVSQALEDMFPVKIRGEVILTTF
jgi:hypothetical protein